MKLVFILAAAAVGFGVLTLNTPNASAIDCARASTATDGVICGDAAALKADDDMSAAFAALVKKLSASQKKLLIGNQKAWLDERDSCTEAADQTPAQQKACVVDLTNERRAFLTGEPAEGPGTSSPVMPLIRHGADDTYLTSLAFTAPQTPAEELLNATLAHDLAQMHAATSADDYSDNFDARLKYASPALLSVNIVGASQSPKLAHPMPFNYNLNIDGRTGKKLSMADALDKAALAKIQGECLAQLKDYLAHPDDTEGEVDPELIKADIADLDKWSFGASEAKLVFDAGDDPPTGVCRLAYSELRTLFKPGFPLPQ